LKISESSLPGVYVLEPKVFGDARGFFVETFRKSLAETAGMGFEFVQDNQSRSRRGILRGLHYQLTQPQGKLVRVSRGTVFDVAVDIRRGSPHFGQWFGLVLDDVSQRMLYVPPNFAHGFMVLSEEADFVYKCTDYYHPESEQGVIWNDPEIGIQWPDAGCAPLLSDKDAALPRLSEQTQLPVYQAK
tara:strand:+ start:1291 stop:1851 length:561 start_codon:yes stop_codon:yes gene_type:complete